MAAVLSRTAASGNWSHARHISSGTTGGLQWTNANSSESGIVFHTGGSNSCSVTLLGTSAGAPSTSRCSSGCLVQLPDTSLLFDAGDGTQQRLMQAAATTALSLSAVFISHLHGDHVLGLPAFITGALNPYGNGPGSGAAGRGKATPSLLIVGPPGLHRLIKEGFQHYSKHVRNRVQLRVREILAPGDRPSVSHSGFGTRAPVQVTEGGTLVHETDSHTVTAVPTLHTVPSYAYVLQEKPRRGRLDVAACARLGVQQPQDFAALAAGKSVVGKGGVAVVPEQVLGPPTPGRKIVIMGDTTYCPGMVPHAKDADLLVHECTVLGSSKAQEAAAARAGHSASSHVVRFLQETAPRSTLLTHFGGSPETHGAAAASMGHLGLQEAATMQMLLAGRPQEDIRAFIKDVVTPLRTYSLAAPLGREMGGSPLPDSMPPSAHALLQSCQGYAGQVGWLHHVAAAWHSCAEARAALAAPLPPPPSARRGGAGALPWEQPPTSTKREGGGSDPGTSLGWAAHGGCEWSALACEAAPRAPTAATIPTLAQATQRTFEGPGEWSITSGGWVSTAPSCPPVWDVSSMGSLAEFVAKVSGVERVLAGRDFMRVMVPPPPTAKEGGGAR